jgi:hypothetical protein
MLEVLEDVITDIEAGKTLLLAGDEAQLRQLPLGNWIAGTTPYFMDARGGRVSRDEIFVTDLGGLVAEARIDAYGEADVARIARDAKEDGFSVVILPAGSKVHEVYAHAAPHLEGLFMQPIVGWVAGVHLSELGQRTPKVFDGRTGVAHEDHAVVLHAALPPGKRASIGTVNVFQQGDGDVLCFEHDGFRAERCLVNGAPRDFAAYLREKTIDTRLPLVADGCGALVNVSFQAVSEAAVDFYAPVFAGVDYRVAAPVPDYAAAFRGAVPAVKAPFSCNGIQNFLHAELEGKVTEGMAGPISFGEIAYQLLNQALVYLEIR